MKQLFFLVLCLFLFLSISLAFADDAPCDNSNWGIQPQKQSPQKLSAAEKTWDEEEYEYIYENYGSQESPAFLNRENINPNEADYNYGSCDGVN